MAKKKFIYILGILACLIFFTSTIIWYQSQLYDFKTINGQRYTQKHLEDKTLVINYFAKWCAPCLREIPELNKFYKQKDKGVLLFAISYDPLSEQQLLEIKEQYNIEFPIISEIKTPFSHDRPQFLPATFVVLPNGEAGPALFGEQTALNLHKIVSGTQ